LKPKAITIPRSITPQEAVSLQNRLAPLISQESALPEEIRYVAGTDGAYEGNRAAGAAVVIKYGTLQPAEIATARAHVTFPYIPGLLAFREAPIIVRALRKLKHRPDVCIVDGHGLAHPRRFGLACHVGLVMDLPTIGVAKSLLFGREVGERIVDPWENSIAEVVRANGKKLYVSVGHKISLDESVRVVRHCISKRGLEPILLAHQEAQKAKWSIRN
jgi:deoxyribonuclease V